MKIDFNPHAAAQAQSARGPQTQTTPPAPEGSDDGVTITLSQAAKQILKTGDTEYTGKSPAHQARQFIANSLATAATEDGEALNFSGPFGQIVKTFAPGHIKESEVVEEPGAIPEDGGDIGDTGETGATDGGDTTVVAAPEAGDGTGSGETDPTIVVEEPDITEVLDESAPTDGETGETESGSAGSGDAVAVVDTGDVTDELLDQLDENSEEVV